MRYCQKIFEKKEATVKEIITKLIMEQELQVLEKQSSQLTQVQQNQNNLLNYFTL